MILYVENPKYYTYTQKLLELIKEFSKVAEYKISTQNPVAFLYNNNDQSEKEILKTIPFTIAPKRIKYLRINFTKEVKHVYIENYKALLKEIKDINKWKDISCMDQKTSVSLKCVCCPKSSTDSMQSLSKS